MLPRACLKIHSRSSAGDGRVKPMKNDGKRYRWSRGNLTIEAALWMPVILLVWMGTVSVCLFVHNRAWLTAAAYEAAITGSWDAVCAQGNVEERAWEKIHTLMDHSLYGSRDIRTAVEKNGEMLTVSMEGRHSSYGGLRWQFRVEGSRKICRPVSFIRKARGLQQIGGQIGGSS